MVEVVTVAGAGAVAVIEAAVVEESAAVVAVALEQPYTILAMNVIHSC